MGLDIGVLMYTLKTSELACDLPTCYLCLYRRVPPLPTTMGTGAFSLNDLWSILRQSS